MFSFSPYICGVLILLVVLAEVVDLIDATALIESSCYMKMTFPTSDTNDIVTIEDVAMIESSMTTYFRQLFIYDTTVATTDSTSTSTKNPMYDILIDSDDTSSSSNSKNDKNLLLIPLQFHVEVADSILIGNIVTVTAQVSLLYESESSDMIVSSTRLAQTLTLVHLNDDHAEMTSTTLAAFTSDPSLVTILFASNDSTDMTSSIILKDGYDNNNQGNYTSTEVALIVVSVFLSIVLFIVSSVLLHITGGWRVFINAVSNCLFEEVDDDYDQNKNANDYNNNTVHKNVDQSHHQHYIDGVQPSRTFPLQRSQDQAEDENVGPVNVEEEEEDTNFMDVESTMTSVLPTSASGLLGVSRNKENGAVAVHTMLDDDDDESNIYGDGMTPISHANHEPLGITSMRKLQTSTVESNKNTKVGTGGGFSNGMMMIQRRLLPQSASKQQQPTMQK